MNNGMWVQVVVLMMGMVGSTASIVLFFWRFSDNLKKYFDEKLKELNDKINTLNVGSKEFVPHPVCKCSRNDLKKEILDKVEDKIKIATSPNMADTQQIRKIAKEVTRR